ncbi:hypothetical protein [Lewinella sp. W8]|uniref:hypothetical protein n=1 Tax=Lewinella sp. W8 TaxID=2528208 RepID=UPI001067769F|nr:hypothetical protein [Lewinella sp. W8]MTB52784.1 hypothetical protein [Lewinella sp. W8]
MMKFSDKYSAFRNGLVASAKITGIIALISLMVNYLLNVSNGSNLIISLCISLFTFSISLIIAILDRILKNLNEFGLNLRFQANNIKDRISISQINSNLKSLNEYINDDRRNELTKSSLLELTSQYFKRLEIQNDSFLIQGEQTILNAYSLFWENMIIEQKRRKKLKKDPLIARITHSNSLRVWSDNGPDQTKDLYKLQKEFIDYGGRVIRFIGISKANLTPDENTKHVLSKMDAHDICAYYVPAKKDYLEYDYLYLYDEKLILRWYTTSGGTHIARMEVVENATTEDPAYESWSDLWYLCIELHGNAAKERLNGIIPDNRQFSKR